MPDSPAQGPVEDYQNRLAAARTEAEQRRLLPKKPDEAPLLGAQGVKVVGNNLVVADDLASGRGSEGTDSSTYDVLIFVAGAPAILTVQANAPVPLVIP